MGGPTQFGFLLHTGPQHLVASKPLEMRKPVRPVLQPRSPDAFTFIGFLTLILLFGASILLFTNTVILTLLRTLSGQNGSPHCIALAACVLTFEFSVLLICSGHMVAPALLPLHRIFHGPLRYRRTHFSHMRLDRFRRLVENANSVSILSPQRLREPTSVTTSRSPGSRVTQSSCPSAARVQLVGGSGTHQNTPLLWGAGNDNDAVIDDGSMPGLEVVTDDDDDSKSPDAFVVSEWIGCGKTWGPNMPRHVRHARNRARSVPKGASRTLIPSPFTSVADVLRSKSILATPAPTITPPTYSLDSTPNILNDDPTSSEFTHALVNLCGPALAAAVPHIRALRDGFNNAWLSGAKSILISNAPPYCFPLWIENLMGDLDVAYRKLQKWVTASNWLCTISSSRDSVAVEIAEECLECLEDIPWDTLVPGLGCAHFSATDLAAFLSDDWLNDDMIDAGSAYIMRELGQQSRVMIADCHFMESLRCERSRSEHFTPRQHHPVDTAILDGRVDILEVPVNPGRVHWAGIQVNIPHRSFAYRDGFHTNTTASPGDLGLLTWYLTAMGRGVNQCPISHTSSTLPVPRQYDSHSCGIVFLSSIASEHLGYEPWSQARSSIARMEWFLRLAENLSCPDQCGDSGVDCCSTNGSIDSASLPSSSGSMDIDDSPTPEPQSPNRTDKSVHNQRPFHSFQPTTRKRPSPAPDSDTDSDESDSSEHRCVRSRWDVRSGTTRKSSWARQKELKQNAASPGFVANQHNLRKFRTKVLHDDPHAEFKANDLRAVRCSTCTEWIKMRVLYDTKRWKVHRDSSKCRQRRKKGVITKSLRTFFMPPASIPSPPPSTHSLPHFPCPGLTRESDPRIDRYLSRSSALGGGAISRPCIIQKLFPTLSDEDRRWPNLSAERQRMVVRYEQSNYKWLNRRDVAAVFSSTCDGLSLSKTEDGSPCEQCQGLRKLHTFQNIIQRKMPEEQNMKYVPLGYRCADLGEIYLKYKGVRKLIEEDDGNSPWLRFAKGAADGLYKSSEVVLGMVEAMVKKTERVVGGKSLKNMKYTEVLDSFCSLLASTSTRAYKTFQRQFGGRSIRSIQALRAKQPRFQPGICKTNVEQAAESLRRLEYAGPLSLAWDDTDLEKALSVWQESKSAWAILGAVKGPIPVTSIDEVDKVFEEAQLEKAEKLRIWVLIIPLPKIPPILLAAVARSSRDTAEELSDMHFELTDLMHQAGLHAISLPADGTETERAAQRIIAASAHAECVYPIPNKVPGCALELVLPLFHSRPTIIVQDSKHGAKTARNQLFTGARLLALGNFPVYYKMLLDMAEHALGPLFRRDVERVDRQDDRAAARLFSAEALDFNIKHFPERPALSAYLFILGELVDAWQNRNISHATRAKMVLRARFFLMAWRSHTDQHPDHNVNVNFISRESYDIFLTLCDSLLQLIIAHRMYYPTYPLLPWLHSTEPCEHIFGMLRQLKKDFNYADILHLEPKLRALMMGAFQHLSPEERANQTAAGYHHTYFHAPDIDLAILMKWPSDAILEKASSDAFCEAEQILAAVGIDARQMMASYRPPSPPKTKGMPTAQPYRPQTLHDVLQLYSHAALSAAIEDEVETCEMALVADDADKTLAILALPDSTLSDENSIRAELEAQCRAAIEAFNAGFSGPVIAPEASAGCDLSDMAAYKLNHDVLVSIRQQHQPLSTAKAVRQANRLPSALPPSAQPSATLAEVEPQPSVREAILKRLSALVPDPHSTTAGANRQIRHTGVFVMGQTNTRAAQKVTLQDATANHFARRREQAFNDLQNLHENMHNANISDIQPLVPGQFVAFLKPNTKDKLPEVVLGEVLTMYTHSGGRGVRHEWTSSVRRLGIASYINVRVYRFSHGSSYSSMSCPSLGCSAFMRVPATHLIFSFGTASSNIVLRTLETEAAHPFMLVTLCSLASGVLRELRARATEVSSAVQLMVKSRKAAPTRKGPDTRKHHDPVESSVDIDGESDDDEDVEV
ncbi:hypothetical protein BV22DRAFT_1029216 [Leucogyrophana mollusca]|uniref:Uncharacterized protein n=1 Tax=Leucogyrophana mollusca TaxID=85980 RepID=A0ACB8BWS5_9AGAM|nr:hypothetical protein BV22DRAFT_1029216 [Leucogyrophana mollusca]